jgi:hypothetical protein
MRRYLQTGYLLFMLLAAGTSTLTSAQNIDADIDSEEPPPPQFYQVELIVFRHLDQSGTTGEIPRMPEPEMTDFLEQDLARLAGEQLPTQAEPDEAPVPIIAVTSDEPTDELIEEALPAWLPVDSNNLLLANAATTIDELAAYELLVYLSWAQTAEDVTIAETLDLHDLGADAAVLTGKVELHQRRYLHLTLEVALASPDSATDTGLFGDTFQMFASHAALPAIKDSRRIRLNRLYYFDQPQLGVIATVSRFVIPEYDPEDETKEDGPEEGPALTVN